MRITKRFVTIKTPIEGISKTAVRVGRKSILITPRYRDNLKEFISKWF